MGWNQAFRHMTSDQASPHSESQYSKMVTTPKQQIDSLVQNCVFTRSSEFRFGFQRKDRTKPNLSGIPAQLQKLSTVSKKLEVYANYILPSTP